LLLVFDRERPYSAWVCDFNAAQGGKAFVVKKMSYEQSRRNAARRRRKVTARHRQAGRWGERPVPMLISQKISYEVGGNVEAARWVGFSRCTGWSPGWAW